MNLSLLRLFRILRPLAGDVLRFDGKAFVNHALGFSRVLTGTATWNPPSMANQADQNQDVTVTGAALGDACIASLTTATIAAGGTRPGAWALSCNVSAADTCSINLTNETASTINLDEGTLRCIVFKLS